MQPQKEKNIFYFINDLKSLFEINDINKLSGHYSHIYVFVEKKIDEVPQFPSNVTVFENYIEWNNYTAFNVFLQHLFSILGIYIRECIALKKILPFKKTLAVITSNIFKAQCIVKACSQNKLPLNNSIVYSFWFYDCIFLAWLKKTQSLKLAITRAHSGDLYEEHVSIKNNVLLRNFQLKYLDAVLPVSNMGKEYLTKKYPKSNALIETIFLGSKDYGNVSVSLPQIFTIVSCANIRHHKRIYKIAEMLQYIDFPLQWIHIGDENLNLNDPKIDEYKKNKEKLRQKDNIIYNPIGFIDNEKIFEFYKSTPVSLFISLSRIEGIPVSMMEAISFGVPVLSTDVGGCKEIVTEQTGILIPFETEMKVVAKIISEFKNSSKNTSEFRTRVRKYWEEKFDVEKNYEKFFEIVN